MIVIIKNKEVVGILNKYPNEYQYNGVRYLDIKRKGEGELKSIGIYTVKFPPIDLTKEEYTSPYYLEENDEVLMGVRVKILSSLEELKIFKRDEFMPEFQEISQIINYCLLNKGNENIELNALISYARRVKNLTELKINSFTDRDELLSFHFRAEDKQEMIDKFKPFM